MKCLIAVILLCSLCGCRSSKPQAAHWDDGRFISSAPETVDDHYRCDNNGKSIAEVLGNSASNLDVFGGDGSGYGNYPSVDSAKKKAEQIQFINRYGIGSDHNFCD